MYQLKARGILYKGLNFDFIKDQLCNLISFKVVVILYMINIVEIPMTMKGKTRYNVPPYSAEIQIFLLKFCL